ncbi:MAG TPA: hypothetical protein DDZ51_25860 [Planctomycetaceae bacterium]|nr:hypothetical protein [Planctomycetaceae bacterium]
MMHSHHKTIMTIVMTLLILMIDQSKASQPLSVEILDDAYLQHPQTDNLSSVVQTALPIADSVIIESDEPCAMAGDRLWLISTRHLATQACRANLDSVDFCVSQLDTCGNRTPQPFESFLSNLSADRTVVIHVHGNRLTEAEAKVRGRFVYRNVKSNAADIPMDFICFSWPAEQQGWLIRDGRTKAEITEAQSLYFATLMRELVKRESSIVVVAYSFGSRVVSGGLHCLAGGSLSGRRLPTEPIVGANIAVGMVAPAVQADWLGNDRRHAMATKNISELTILFNTRDAVLKRYWLVESGSRGPALGYAGPTRIAPGYNGMPVPLIKCDCARFLGLAHNEQEYYTDGCNAGRMMAALIRKNR